MNSDVPKFVRDNLVQAHISGTDKYLEGAERAFTMVSVVKEASGDTGHSATSLAQANKASSGRYRGSGGRGGPRQGAGRGGDLGAAPGRMHRCHKCGSGRHFYAACPYDADNCGEEEDTEVADTEVSCTFNRGYDRVVTLAQQGKISLSPNIILLDSCSM